MLVSHHLHSSPWVDCLYFSVQSKARSVRVVGFGLGVCAAAPFLTLSPYKPYLTRFGVMVLMISFGASFGFTVMGRISLAIGRAQEMLGQNRPPEEVAVIHPQAATLVSLLLLIVGMIALKRFGSGEASSSSD